MFKGQNPLTYNQLLLSLVKMQNHNHVVSLLRDIKQDITISFYFILASLASSGLLQFSVSYASASFRPC